MGSKGKRRKRIDKDALDIALSKIIRRKLKKIDRERRKAERKHRKRRRQTASDIIQNALERMESSSSPSTTDANSDQEDERNNKSSPVKHTEEVTRAATIEDSIVLSSDSDVDPKEEAKGSKKGNEIGRRINTSKEEIKFNDNPSTSKIVYDYGSSQHHSMAIPSTSAIVDDIESSNHHSTSKIVTGNQTNKAKRKRKKKVPQIISIDTYRRSHQHLQKFKSNNKLIKYMRYRTYRQFVEEITASPNSPNSQNNRLHHSMAIPSTSAIVDDIESSNHHSTSKIVTGNQTNKAKRKRKKKVPQIISIDTYRRSHQHLQKLKSNNKLIKYIRYRTYRQFVEEITASPNSPNSQNNRLGQFVVTDEENGESDDNNEINILENVEEITASPNSPNSQNNRLEVNDELVLDSSPESPNFLSPRASSLTESCEKNVGEVTDCSDISDDDFSPNDECIKHAGYDKNLQNYGHDEGDVNRDEDNGCVYPLSQYYDDYTRDYYDNFGEEVVIDDQHEHDADPSTNNFHGNLPYTTIHQVDRPPISCSPNCPAVTIRHDDVADEEQTVVGESYSHTLERMESSSSPSTTDANSDQEVNDNPSTSKIVYDYGSSQHHSMAIPSTSAIVDDIESSNHHSTSKIVTGNQTNKAKRKQKKNVQFVETDEENGESDDNNEINILENVEEITASPNSPNSQNNRLEVNDELVLDSSPESPNFLSPRASSVTESCEKNVGEVTDCSDISDDDFSPNDECIKHAGYDKNLQNYGHDEGDVNRDEDNGCVYPLSQYYDDYTRDYYDNFGEEVVIDDQHEHDADPSTNNFHGNLPYTTIHQVDRPPISCSPNCPAVTIRHDDVADEEQTVVGESYSHTLERMESSSSPSTTDANSDQEVNDNPSTSKIVYDYGSSQHHSMAIPSTSAIVDDIESSNHHSTSKIVTGNQTNKAKRKQKKNVQFVETDEENGESDDNNENNILENVEEITAPPNSPNSQNNRLEVNDELVLDSSPESPNFLSPRASSVTESCEKNVGEVTDCSDISDDDFSPNDECIKHAGYDKNLQNYGHDEGDVNRDEDNGCVYPLSQYYDDYTRDYYDNFGEEVVIDDQHEHDADPSTNNFHGNLPYTTIHQVDRPPISCSPNCPAVTIRHDDVADEEQTVVGESYSHTLERMESSSSPSTTDANSDQEVNDNPSTSKIVYDYGSSQHHSMAIPSTSAIVDDIESSNHHSTSKIVTGNQTNKAKRKQKKNVQFVETDEENGESDDNNENNILENVEEITAPPNSPNSQNNRLGQLVETDEENVIYLSENEEEITASPNSPNSQNNRLGQLVVTDEENVIYFLENVEEVTASPNSPNSQDNRLEVNDELVLDSSPESPNLLSPRASSVTPNDECIKHAGYDKNLQNYGHDEGDVNRDEDNGCIYPLSQYDDDYTRDYYDNFCEEVVIDDQHEHDADPSTNNFHGNLPK